MASQKGLEIWGNKIGLYRAYTNHCMRVLPSTFTLTLLFFSVSLVWLESAFFYLALLPPVQQVLLVIDVYSFLCTQRELQNFRRNVKTRPYRLLMSLPSRRPYLTHINADTSVTCSSFGQCPRHRIVSGPTYYPCIWTDRWCWNCSQSPEVEIVEEVMYRAYLHPHGHRQAERMKMLTQLKGGLFGIWHISWASLNTLCWTNSCVVKLLLLSLIMRVIWINIYIYNILYMLLCMFETVINISSKTFFVRRNSIYMLDSRSVELEKHHAKLM